MSLSPIAFFGLLDETNPVGTDSRTISDDQHRNIIASMKQQAPNWTAAVTATHGDMNLLAGYVAAGQKPMPGVGGTTATWFYNNTVPVGWTLLAADANLRNLSIAPGGAVPVGGGTIAGVDDPSNLAHTTVIDIVGPTGGTALTIDQIPLHNHPGSSVPTSADEGGFDGTVRAARNAVGGGDVNVGAQGGGQAHDHSFSGSDTDAFAFNPRRAMGVLGTLNA